jgi:2-keto-4-pentenoate hydratase
MTDASDALARGMARQLSALRAALAAGMPRAGWKIGLNSRAAQARLGVPGPCVGWLHGGRILPSGSTYLPPTGAKLHVEAEVCVRVGRAVRAGTPAAEARAAIADVAPALEIVDHARSWDGLEAIVAHSTFHEATVRGASVPLRAWPELGVEVPRLFVDGMLRAEPHADLVPADLGKLVAFVAGFLAPFGESLAAGDLILSGAYTDPVPLRPRSMVVAGFGTLGEVTLTTGASAAAV